MDRTAEFLELVGRPGGSSIPPNACFGAFMRAATEQRKRLHGLRRAHRLDGIELAEIHACQDEMTDLEKMAQDLRDLGPRAPKQTRDEVAVRKGVIGALYEELRDLASLVQSEQVSELERHAEAVNFFTGSSSGSTAAAKPPPLKPPPPPMDGNMPGLLNPDQLQIEEQILLASFTTDLDKIQETRQKLEEVSVLVGLFSTKVVEQQEQVDNIYDLAEQSTAYIVTAEKHLHQAIKNSDSYRFYVVCWFVGSALFLLVFDFIDSRFSPI